MIVYSASMLVVNNALMLIVIWLLFHVVEEIRELELR